MELQPIKRVSISEQVFGQFKQKIIEGEWKQGEKLPSENELSESLAVSRVTVRQAIHKLVVLGLADTKSGEGTFVKALEPGVFMQHMIPVAYLSPRDTLEVLDFRYVIEVETAAMAAQRCQPEDVVELQQQFERMMDARGNYWDFSKADLEFHLLTARITRNSLIIETYSILRDILEVCMNKTVEHLGVEIGIPYHKRLIEAFARGDAPEAKEIMRAHMIATRKEFEAALQKMDSKQQYS